jgi:hypothetical protein
MQSFELDGKIYVTIAHEKPYTINPVIFLAGYEVHDPGNKVYGVKCELKVPTTLQGRSRGLVLEVIGTEKNLIKHAFEEGIKIDGETAKCSIRDHFKLNTKEKHPQAKPLSKCSRKDLIVMILNEIWPGEENLNRRLELLKLQKAKSVQDRDGKLLNVLESLEGPAKEKYASLKSSLEGKSKLSDTESNTDNDNVVEGSFGESDGPNHDDDAVALKKAARQFKTPDHYVPLLPEGGKLLYCYMSPAAINNP